MYTCKIIESSLMDCIVIVHTKVQTLGGVISYIEGDVIEFSFKAEFSIDLGQEIGVTIYSPDGLIVFDTYPVATYYKRFLCILPPNFQKLIINRRKDIRVPVQDLQWTVETMKPEHTQESVRLEQLVICNVDNLCLSGLLFSLSHPLPLKPNTKLTLRVSERELEIDVRHSQKTEGSGIEMFGAEFCNMSDEDQHVIRSLLVKQQALNRPAQIKSENTEQN